MILSYLKQLKGISPLISAFKHPLYTLEGNSPLMNSPTCTKIINEEPFTELRHSPKVAGVALYRDLKRKSILSNHPAQYSPKPSKPPFKQCPSDKIKAHTNSGEVFD